MTIRIQTRLRSLFTVVGNWSETKSTYKRTTYHSHLHEGVERTVEMLLNCKQQGRIAYARGVLLLMSYWEMS